jgi:hypothetical protein
VARHRSRQRKTSPQSGGQSPAPPSPPSARSRAATLPAPFGSALVGRSFVHPLFDYLVIGGGLSLVASAIAVAQPQFTAAVGLTALAYTILLCNSAHFAASTVRLYSKPGARQTWPFLTMGLPIVALLALAACLTLPEAVGRHALGLTLTWSAYHYAAQAYGLSVLYAYRSGCQLSLTDKRLLWVVSLLPFIYVVCGGVGLGLDWLVPASILTAEPIDATLRTLAWLLPYVGFAAIAAFLFKTWRSESGPVPLISLLVLVANGVWWFILDPLGAFTVATVFHGLQYLGIVTIFHVKEQMAQPGNQRGPAYHVLWFYGASLVLGYALFNCLPWGFDFLGFGLLQSVALVVVAVNIHHFVVDAFIWRLRPGGTNRQITEARHASVAA